MLRPDQLAGKTISKYKIDRKIGEGGMAHVYLARDTALSRSVAIKVLDAARANDSRFVARFEREARIAAQLKHPNIVTVFDVLKTNGLFLIVMEYVEGHGLDVVLHQARTRNETLDMGYTLFVIRQVGEALDYAYQHGRVVHRDIKPANILVMPNTHVKLTDFGIARALEEDSQLTSDAYLGTPFYMSPEQFKGEKVDYRSDIYSLGVVLYQMMVNVTGPFGDTSTNVAALMHKHISIRPLPPRTVNPTIKPAVEKVILKALEKEPYKRHQSGADLANDLAAAYTVPVRAAGMRWLVPVLGLLALLFVLLGGIVFLIGRNLQQQASADNSTPLPSATSIGVTLSVNDVVVASPTVLYAGPSHNYPELGQLAAGLTLTLEAISPDVKWGKVVTSDAVTGWLPLNSLDLGHIDLAAVPEAVVIPPTPPQPAFTATLAPLEPTATTMQTIEAASPPQSLATATPTRRPSPTPTTNPTATEAVPAVAPPARSAQAAQVVYVQSNGDGHYLGLVTSGGEVLNGGLHQFAAAPAWSPTGGQIAFFGEPGISQLGGSYSAGNGLWLLDATQPNTVPSWQIKAEDHIKNIAWSPDGTKIAYETTPPNVTSAIVVVDAQGGADISRFPGAQPAWSPNSQQLIIKTCAPDCGLWQVNFDGSGVQQQTFDASDSYPTWSVNNQVAFSTSRDSNWEIYLLNLNNSSLSRVTQRPSTDITPVFSADGREIYLRTDYYGGWRITALALDGSNERTVKEGVGESTDWGLARPAIH